MIALSQLNRERERLTETVLRGMRGSQLKMTQFIAHHDSRFLVFTQGVDGLSHPHPLCDAPLKPVPTKELTAIVIGHALSLFTQARDWNIVNREKTSHILQDYMATALAHITVDYLIPS